MQNLVSKFRLISIVLLLPIAILATLSGCSSSEKDKVPLIEIDQTIRDSRGHVTFARAHYIMAKTATMNKARANKTLEKIRKSCPNSEFALIRQYQSETDYVTLRTSFARSRKVKIYEYKCRY